MEAEKVEVYKCSRCGTHFKTFKAAQDCCKDRYCELCGAVLPKNHLYLWCDKCREAHKYDDYKHMSIKEYEEEYPDYMVCYGDNYYTSVDDCLEYLYGDLTDEEWDNLHFIMGTTRSTVDIDIEYAVESAEEDFEDELFDRTGLDELYSYVNEWNKKNGVPVYYEAKILIDIPDEVKAEYNY